jgi:amino acid adenylation domain-containing protein
VIASSVGPTAPAPDSAPPSGATPLAALTARLCECAARALGAPAIESERPLTALGLDSLAAVEIVSEVEAAFGVTLPLADLLGGATARELAERLLAATAGAHAGSEMGAQSSPGAASAPAAPVAPGAAAGDDLPLSAGQRALWFMERLAPQSGVCNIALAARARGLDPAALRRALAALAARHPALRTVFPAADGEPVARLLPAVEVDLAVASARGWDRRRLQQQLAAAAWRPFDLERGPLLRVRLWERHGGRWVLLLAVHHLVADFWSLAVLVRELGAALDEATTPRRGEARSGPLPAPGSHADFVRRQTARLRGQDGERLWEFWSRTLAGERGPVPDLSLPTDLPRPAAPTWHGTTHAARLSPAVVAGLRRLAGAEGATLFAVLAAAWQAQLGRYADQDDFAVGTPTSGRTSPEWTAVVGYFVNPVALRADLAGDPSFRELVRRARRTAVAALAHAELPFAQIAERLRPVRDPARQPLFQVMLALEPRRQGDDPGLAAFALAEDGARISLGKGTELISLALDERRAQLDLTLAAAELPGSGLGLSLEVSADLFDAASAARMLGHFVTLVAAAVAAPDRAAADLPLLAAAEIAQLEQEWGAAAPAGQARPLDEPAFTLHGLVAERARRSPDAVAMVAEAAVAAASASAPIAAASGDAPVTGRDACWTYGELAARAAALARRLVDAGVAAPERPVALLVERSADLVIGALGILAAGGVYLPLDPKDAPSRLALILEESDAAALLTRRRLAGRLPRTAPSVLLLDEPAWPRVARAAPAAPAARKDRGAPAVLPGQLAYLIYTSGSTGRPKGVAVTHAAAAAECLAWGRAHRLSERDRVLQFSAAGFDAAIDQVFATLLAGALLALRGVAPWGARDLAAHAARWDLTVIDVPTAFAVHWVEDAPDLGAPSRSLRLIVVSGEELRPETVRRFGRGPLARIELHNCYGPTEAVISATLHAVRPADGAAAAVPIGRPLPGRVARVLDRRGRPQPAGIPGELFLGGVLARGYLGHPEWTAERFLPDAWGAPGERLYRTGDLARRRADGALEFLGRADRQVKVRGFRVEPGEIEAALAAHPAVREAAVLALPASPAAVPAPSAPPSSPGAAAALRLVAWVTPALPPDARAFLAARLPDYMLPAAWMALPALPLNAAGKVDRPALARRAREAGSLAGEAMGEPVPFQAAAAAAAAAGSAGAGRGMLPRSPEEEILADIWADLLGLRQVGPGDDFFALGGHSLLATRLVSQVSRRCGVELPVAAVFAAPTLAALAARVREAARGPAATAAPPLVPVRRAAGEALPLSSAQRRLWLLDQLEPGTAVYNVPGAARLRGPLDLPALHAALSEIVRRHEALRTSFGAGDEPYQMVEPAAVPPLPLVDLSPLAAPVRAAAASREARAEARRPFDLTRGPVLRLVLLRLGPAEHLLLATFHHIAADGWSLGLFLDELAALYGVAAGTPAPAGAVPELPVQVADFAVWQRRWLDSGALAGQLAYWRERLAGLPALELPTDRPRPPVRSSRGATRGRQLPAAAAAAVAALARRQGVTLFMALLGAFQALLARWCGEEVVAVGAPAAGRGHPEIERLIGLFVNTLVLDVRVGDDPPLSVLFERVRQACLGAYAHQDLPFELLVDELRPERDLAHHPLFQVMLTLEEPLPPRRLGGAADPRQAAAAPPAAPRLPLTLEPLRGATGTAKFDLLLAVAPLPDGGWNLLGEYAAALWEAASVDRLLGHLDALLAGAAAAPPETRLSELPLLAAAERHQLLREWNDAPVPAAPAAPAADAVRPGIAAPTAPRLHDLVAAQAARTPDAVAVVAGSASVERLTYGALLGRARALAAVLRPLGIGPESRVGVCLERNADLVAAVLGILEAGAAYVPLDPDYPRARLELMLADAEAQALVVAPALAGRFAAFTGPVVELAGGRARQQGAPDAPPAAAGPLVATPALPVAGEHNLAYVIFTSGSTGRPKGVAIEHRSAVALVRWALAAYSPRELAGVLMATSLCFDLSVFELFVPLAAGGRVILAGNLLALPELPAASEVTLVNAVPSPLAALVDGSLPAGLRTVNLAGEPLPPELAARIHAHPQVERLLNLYGPSEDTTYSTLASVPRGAASIPIGRPLPGTRARVLGRHGEPLPIGVPGELLLAGVGLARGYLGRPQATAERFVPDPWGAAGARMYRTGDRVRLLGDGRLEFLGRLDRQVKLRGFRLELGEIEAHLERHPAVSRAAVALRGEGAPGERLVAYVVAAAGGDGGDLAPALEAWLRRQLPAIMVPRTWVALPALPLSLNGKVDRRALPPPPAGRPAAGAGADLPRNAVEERLAAIWRETLGCQRVGIHDGFFALGGHSLLAVRAAFRVGRAFGVEVPAAALFGAPTVAELAAWLRRSGAPGAPCDTPPAATPAALAAPAVAPGAPAAPAAGRFPLSFAQEGLWFLERLQPGRTDYNLGLSVRLRGRLGVAALAASLNEIVHRHEPLRTVYGEANGRPFQLVLPPPGAGSPARGPGLSPAAGGVPKLALCDLRALPRGRRDAARRQAAAALTGRPFDLGGGPVARFLLLRVARAEHVLHVAAHHLTADGWSMEVFFADLAALYAAAISRRSAALPNLPWRYADHVLAQRRDLAGEHLAAQLEYWRRQLAGAPALELPLDWPRPPAWSTRGAGVPLVLPGALAAELAALARAEGATLFATLAAGFHTLLSRLGGCADVSLGVPVAGRGRAETEGMIGLFVNTLVLRVDQEDGPTFRQLVDRVHHTAAGAQAHQETPFERLVEELQPERAASSSPLFQAAFGLLSASVVGGAPPALPGLALELLDDEIDTARFELACMLAERGGRVAGWIEYATALLARATVTRLRDSYLALLSAAAAAPDRRALDLPLLAAAERHQLLVERPADRASLGPAAAPVVARRTGARPRRGQGDRGGAGETASARTPEEEILAALWSEVLGLPRPGGLSRDDDFFALGGHSLLITQLASRIRRAFGCAPPLSELFAARTLAAQAARIAATVRARVAGPGAGRRPELPPIPPLLPRRRSGPAPLSFAQERLWFLDRLEPGPLYNMPLAARLAGPLDVPAMAAALDRIVCRHEALRTRFVEDGGRPLQQPLPWPAPGPTRDLPERPLGLPLSLIDLSPLPAARRQAAAWRLAAAEARRPFDLASGRLLRPTLLRLVSREPAEHWLLLTMHHIAADGWSIGVLLAELVELYAAAHEGRPAHLCTLPVQYADFALWQREWLRGARLTQEIEHWRRCLAGAPEALDLPTDRPRRTDGAAPGSQVALDLDAPTTAALLALARQRAWTPFMPLLAAFAGLLVLWSGRRGSGEAVIGSPIANRQQLEIERLIGFFANTLALRLDLAGDPTFAELGDRARAVCLDAYTHQDLPFEKLVEELAPPRAAGRAPLFQAMLVLQNAPLALAMPGLDLDVLEPDTSTAKFDLVLGLRPAAGGLAGGIEYRRDLFDQATVARLAGQLRILLAGAIADPETRLSRLPLLTPGEIAEIAAWSAPARSWPGAAAAAPPPSRLVHARVAARAAVAPDACAVRGGGESLSYGELLVRARALASRLRLLGVGPDLPVALFLDRSLDAMVAVLAVLEAGGAYLPLDPDHPPERLRLMLEDAAAPVLLTCRRLAAVAPVGAARLVATDAVADEEAGAGPASALPAPPVLPEHLAYVIYTSGSTGRPKGVAMSHGAIAAMLDWQLRTSAAGGGRTLQYTSLAFDVSCQEIFSTWAAGGTLVLISEAVRRDPAALCRMLAEQRIERLFMPFVALQQLAVAAGTPAVLEPAAFPAALREVMSAGEQLHVTPEIAALFARLPGAALYNHYGPTETHVATWLPLGGDPRGWPERPAIGRPLEQARVLLLDERLRWVPLGVAGEVWVAGAGLARGYLGRPDLTAERFLPDPFADLPGWQPGDRMYRTGDLVRLDPRHGEAEFLGRADFQVKVRGHRIELAEVEAAIARHPAVAQAAAAVEGETADARRLVAYVVLRPEVPPPSPAELRAFLATALPGPMVPTGWVGVARLPLTATGKLDRRALGSLEGLGSWGDGGPAASGLAAPSTPAEELLAGIWREVLAVQRVGAEDDFFALGGHSLLATQVASRVREVFAVELPLRRLFEAPTLAALAGAIEELRGSTPPAPPAPPLRRQARAGDLPLSFAQERLWFLDHLQAGPAYNLLLLLRSAGRLDRVRLAAALAGLADRHEVLRTVFAEHDGVPAQVVLPAAAGLPPGASGLPLAVADLGGLPPGRRAAEAHRVAARFGGAPFDLARGPLLRVLLLPGGAADGWLCVGLHHIAGDGWSLGVLVREVRALYAGAPLPALPVQYADFAIWQRAWLAGDVLERQLAWWRERLADAPAALALPTDRPRPALAAMRGAELRCDLAAPLAARLLALGRRAGVTPFMVLAGGLFTLLARASGQHDVVIGTPIANRNRIETEGLIGFFVNTLVLRAAVGRAASFDQLLRQVREANLGAYAHQDLPFEKLVDELHPQRDPSRSPLFQVALALQNAPLPAAELGGAGGLPAVRLSPEELPLPVARFDLTWAFAAGTGGCFEGALQFATDLFDAPTAARLARHFATLLGNLVADPRARLDEVPLLAAAELHQVLHEWNDRPVTAGEPPSAHRLVAAWAARRPAALAVAHGARQFTYGEIDARAGDLARRACQAGVGPGAPAALWLERSPELIVAALAAWKAGGPYLPLDPAWPVERVCAVVADAGAPLLVTDRPRLAALAARASALPGVETVCLELAAPAPADVALPTPADVALPAPADVALPAPADVALPAPSPPAGVAYVIYTSGSTGRPKGVEITHGGLAGLVRWWGAAYQVGPADRATLLASPGFDASVLEIWPQLAAGASLHVPDEEVRLSPARLLAWLAAEGITLCFLPTPLAEQLLAALDEHGVPPGLRLRALQTGGDRLRRRPRGPLPFAFVNHYGPAECTVIATGAGVAPEPAAAAGAPARPPAIGRPVAAARAHVVTAGLVPAPIGVAGELLLGGGGLARGYLGRPELTAERFVPDPFAGPTVPAGGAGGPGGRLYRTGDLVRARADGELEFLGRLDQQVKVRGQRLELGEVEAALGRHPGVREAAVAAHEDGSGETRLIGYFVAARQPAPVAAELRAALLATLPEAMVPWRWVELPAMPLTSAGKLDRMALPAPAAAGTGGGSRGNGSHGGGAYVPPRNDLERTIAAVWRDLLALPEVGVDENFFAAGGSSLLIIQLQSRLRQALGREIPTLELFRHPTIASLAHSLDGGSERADSEAAAAAARQRARTEVRREAMRQLQRPGRRPSPRRDPTRRDLP